MRLTILISLDIGISRLYLTRSGKALRKLGQTPIKHVIKQVSKLSLTFEPRICETNERNKRQTTWVTLITT